jgi:hypothetical protein
VLLKPLANTQCTGDSNDHDQQNGPDNDHDSIEQESPLLKVVIMLNLFGGFPDKVIPRAHATTMLHPENVNHYN